MPFKYQNNRICYRRYSMKDGVQGLFYAIMLTHKLIFYHIIVLCSSNTSIVVSIRKNSLFIN